MLCFVCLSWLGNVDIGFGVCFDWCVFVVFVGGLVLCDFGDLSFVGVYGCSCAD